MKGAVSTLAVGLAILLFASVAAAQEPAGDAEAHALFEAGQLAYTSGRFDDALADFSAAYELSHRADLLYNIGQCHDYLRHDRDALAAFEGYLAAVPEAPTRAVVEARVAVLRSAVTASTAAAPPPPEPTPEVAPSTADAPVVPAPAPTAHLAVQGPEGYTLLRRDPASRTVTDDIFVCTVPCEVDVPSGATRLAVATSDLPQDRHHIDHDRLELEGRLRLTLTRVDRRDQRTAGGWTMGLGLGVSLLTAIVLGAIGGEAAPIGAFVSSMVGVASVTTGLVLIYINDTFDAQWVRY
jgi:hypothetical protein